MILVDRRVGSNDFLKPLLSMGVKAELADLEFGDIAFAGRGSNDAPVMVGIEFKNLNDLVASIRSGRLAGHQLPGIRKTYDHAWLLVEGLWRQDDHGIVTTFRGKSGGWKRVHGNMRASELDKTLLTFELCAGVHLHHSHTRQETLRWMVNLYRWWTDTAIDQHTSHLAIHEAPTLVPISPARRTLCTLPGVGIQVSKAAMHYFKSVVSAVNGTEEEWAALECKMGSKKRKLGRAVASRVLSFLHKEQS